ncbi:MAG: hypothetical protein PHO30_06150, partial [Candidatus Omnitrophica bacterium]|nr:hypothetical protein [Candidatus Omnitrophota bacterium]
FPMNFSTTAAPGGASSLYAEVSYSPRHRFNRKTAEKTIRRDLITAGILRPDDKVLTRHVHDIRYGYVVYDHAYRESLATINTFLARSGMLTAGRFGRWKYMSMEDVLLDGKIVSEYIRKT